MIGLKTLAALINAEASAFQEIRAMPEVISVTFSWRWWLFPYVQTLIWAALLSQRQPDWDKLKSVLKRAAVVTIILKPTSERQP